MKVFVARDRRNNVGKLNRGRILCGILRQLESLEKKIRGIVGDGQRSSEVLCQDAPQVSRGQSSDLLCIGA
jgi:hypothetical protein